MFDAFKLHNPRQFFGGVLTFNIGGDNIPPSRNRQIFADTCILLNLYTMSPFNFHPRNYIGSI